MQLIPPHVDTAAIAGGPVQLLKGLDSNRDQSCFLASEATSHRSAQSAECSVYLHRFETVAAADGPVQSLKGLDSNKDQCYCLASVL